MAKFLKIALLVGGCAALIPVVVHAQGIGVSELQRMLVPTPQKVERGEQLYQDNCAVCHGQNGQGQSDIRLSGAGDESFETTDFTEAEYRYGGGPIQIYNAITFGLDEAVVGEVEDEVPPHPLFEHLQYQSRWDLAHYVRSLGPTDDIGDPPELIAEARQVAEEGVCDEEIQEEVAERVEPRGDEQLEMGQELYEQQCVSCHGAEGDGEGPAGGALDPPPRDFIDTPQGEWTEKPSAFGIFDVLTNGVPGTSMASYSNLSEEERWALTHYVLEFVPAEVEVEADEEAILSVCRSLSAPEKPDAIPIDVAMQALVEDQAEERFVRMAQHGAPELAEDADPESGEELYGRNCASCHGSAGSGGQSGPHGALPPFVNLQIDRLTPRMAGGTPEDFARRSYAGVHATLPEMTGAARLSADEWADLQAYVAGLSGDSDEQIIAETADDAAIEQARQLDSTDEEEPEGPEADESDADQTEADDDQEASEDGGEETDVVEEEDDQNQQAPEADQDDQSDEDNAQ